MPTGQHWYVSVMVARGARPGKRVAPDQRRAWRRDELDPHGPDRDEPARPGSDVGHGDGGLRRVPPGHRGHGAALAEFRAGHRPDRHEPGMARQRERRRRARPPRRAAVQPAAPAERRLRDRLPHRDDRHRRDRLPSRGMDVPEVKAMAELFPIDQIFDNPAYPGLLPNALDRGGHPGLHARDRSAARPGPRDDPAVRGGHDERAQASRHRRRPDGTHRARTGVFVGNSALPSWRPMADSSSIWSG